jgi:hypothetical protein
MDSCLRNIYNFRFERLIVLSLLVLDFQTGTVSGKAGNQMDWTANNTFKSFKGTEIDI